MGKLLDGGRIVALVGDRDDAVAQPELEEQFGRGGHE
jgi:hypothetical protein